MRPFDVRYGEGVVVGSELQGQLRFGFGGAHQSAVGPLLTGVVGGAR